MTSARFALLCATVGSFVQQASGVRSAGIQTLQAEDDWEIYKPTGPVYKDVAQGELGDCYYLSGIAAIAKTHPELIEKAFVTKGVVNSLGRSVYKLRFLVDGEEKIVAIDDAVPMFEKPYYTPHFYFASFGAKDAAWPALLEKGFAKLFGSFFAIVGGWGFQTFKALTQAPVDVVQRVSKEEMWNFVQEAQKNNWPMTGGSQDNDYGTAADHAFVILSCGTKKGKQAVEVYNPWATENLYTGELKDLTTRNQGDYWMTLEEFSQAFEILSRARIIPNAHVSSIRVKAGAAQAVQFKTSITRKPFESYPEFYVQLEWPDNKLFPRQCTTKKNRMSVFMTVGEKSAGSSGAVHAKRPIEYNAVSNLRATLSATAGTYVALVGTFFENMPGIEEVVVNVYAQEPVTLEKVDVGPVAEALFGLCQRLQWDGKEFVRGEDFRGSPAWDSKQSDAVLWIDYKGGAKVSMSRTMQFSSYGGFKLSDVKCLSHATGGSSSKPSSSPSAYNGGSSPSAYSGGGGSSGSGGHTPSSFPSAYNGGGSDYKPASPSAYNGGGSDYKPASGGSGYKPYVPYKPASPSAYNGGGSDYKPASGGSGYKPYVPYNGGGGSNNYNKPSTNTPGTADNKPYTPGGDKPYVPYIAGNLPYVSPGGYQPYTPSNKPATNPPSAGGTPGHAYQPYTPPTHYNYGPGGSSYTPYSSPSSYKVGSLAETGARGEDILHVQGGSQQHQHQHQHQHQRVLVDEAEEEGLDEGLDEACDQQLVRNVIARYSKLDNYAELAAGQPDKLFPEDITSIGDPNEDCGDAATGEETSCAELNHWKSITKHYGKPSIVPKVL